jgi:hypothetical protein
MNIKCHNELPEVTRENAFDILCFTYRMYAKVLETGGFGSASNTNSVSAINK